MRSRQLMGQPIRKWPRSWRLTYTLTGELKIKCCKKRQCFLYFSLLRFCFWFKVWHGNCKIVHNCDQPKAQVDEINRSIEQSWMEWQETNFQMGQFTFAAEFGLTPVGSIGEFVHLVKWIFVDELWYSPHSEGKSTEALLERQKVWASQCFHSNWFLVCRLLNDLFFEQRKKWETEGVEVKIWLLS